MTARRPAARNSLGVVTALEVHPGLTGARGGSESISDMPVQADRTRGLRQASAAKTADAVARAERGLRSLRKDGGQISVAAVARAGGVTTKFLRSHTDLHQRIIALRDQQNAARGLLTVDTALSPTVLGNDPIIRALHLRAQTEQARHRNEMATLRREGTRLQQQVAALLGQVVSLEADLEATRTITVGLQQRERDRQIRRA